MPPTAKGRVFPVEISVVAWMDLLGYGSMLAKVGFNPSRQQARDAVNRLGEFQRTAATAAHRVFPAMPMNDGVAYFKDLSPRSRSVTADFLHRCIDVFRLVNAADLKNGYPGARMVIAVGPRLRMTGVTKLGKKHLELLLERVSKGTMPMAQALHQAFRAQPISGFVPALQANFAFTRAFLADEAGSKAGLGGPQCYVDLNIFDEQPPDWITFSREQEWCGRGILVLFGEFKDVDWVAAGQVNYAGIRSALEIARTLGIDSHNRSGASR